MTVYKRFLMRVSVSVDYKSKNPPLTELNLSSGITIMANKTNVSFGFCYQNAKSIKVKIVRYQFMMI